MDLPRLNLVVLRVADLARAERFYTALGLAFVRHRHGSGPEHLASELGTGGVFELYPETEKAGSSMGARVGFVVVSVEEVTAALAAAGGEIVSAPKRSPWGMRAVLADPDGHRVEIVEA